MRLNGGDQSAPLRQHQNAAAADDDQTCVERYPARRIVVEEHGDHRFLCGSERDRLRFTAVEGRKVQKKGEAIGVARSWIQAAR